MNKALGKCNYETVRKLVRFSSFKSDSLTTCPPQPASRCARGSAMKPCYLKECLSRRKILDNCLKTPHNTYMRKFHALRASGLSVSNPLENNGEVSVARRRASSLFVSDSVSQNTAPVEVDLQIEKRIARKDDLKRQLKIRGIIFNVDTFVEDYKLMKRLEKEKTNLEQERESIAKQMADLKSKKSTEDVVETRNTLISRGKQIKEALKELQLSWWVWEEKVTLAALSLPNSLRSQTPEGDPKILEEFGELPDMSEAECHVEYVKRNYLVKFSSVGPKAYYLKGKLALQEQSLVKEITASLDQSNFHPLSTPEIFRSLVAEGCGVEYKDKSKIFTLQDKEAAASKLDDFSHVQGVSLMSFAAYLAKTVVPSSELPYRLYTTGRQYTPDAETDLPGLFGVTQSVKTAVMSVTADRVSCLQEMNKLVALAWVIYRKLDLAIRLVVIPGRELQACESLRIEVQMWAPSLKHYIKVAHISCTDDYVSRRLMCYHSSNVNNIKSFQHVHMVYGEVLDVTRLIALMVEHKCESKGSFFFAEEDIIDTVEEAASGIEDIIDALVPDIPPF